MKAYFKGTFSYTNLVLIITAFEEPGVKIARSFKAYDASRILFQIIL